MHLSLRFLDSDPSNLVVMIGQCCEVYFTVQPAKVEKVCLVAGMSLQKYKKNCGADKW